MKNDKEILKEINEIFKDILDIEELSLTKETEAKDIKKWDSLAHMQLVLAISKHFSIKFTTKEIISWQNVGSIVECVKEHLSC